MVWHQTHQQMLETGILRLQAEVEEDVERLRMAQELSHSSSRKYVIEHRLQENTALLRALGAEIPYLGDFELTTGTP